MLEEISNMKVEQENKTKTYIKEFFVSIQGEGPYVGCKQLFIRFCHCNLSCRYCDTDFIITENCNLLTPKELYEKISSLDLSGLHSISLTGGEPLLETNFLKEFIPLTNQKIYLETNGTLSEKLLEIIDLIDFVSMDIKLSSSTKMEDMFKIHKEFIEICKSHQKDIFLKIVFDNNITEEEIEKSIDLARISDCEIILQPMMKDNSLIVEKDKLITVFNTFTSKYQKVRLIPQVHKFIQVE